MASLVLTLRMARFSGVEGGSAGVLRWRVWWNGRISRFTKTKSEAEDVFREIKRRGMTTNRVAIQVTKHYGMLKIAGLNPYPLFLEEDEASELYLKLAEALDQFIHEPDGCRGDCPCKERER